MTEARISLNETEPAKQIAANDSLGDYEAAKQQLAAREKALRDELAAIEARAVQIRKQLPRTPRGLGKKKATKA
jgi:hypothetical protein